MESKHTLTLGHLFKIPPDLKQYVVAKLSFEKKGITITRPNVIIAYHLTKTKKIQCYNFQCRNCIGNLMFNFPHFEREIGVDNTPTCIKVPKLDIARWTLPKDIQVRLLSSGTINNP